MRASLSHARLLAAALVVAATAAIGASSALATSATTNANGMSVTASLSPDNVSSTSGVVSELARVTNTSSSAESLAIRIIGPVPTSVPLTIFTKLQPSASFTRSVSFPAPLLKPGTHTLTVIAVKRVSVPSQPVQATASIKVD